MRARVFSLLAVVMCAGALCARAQVQSLSWDAATNGPVASSYRVYCGTNSRSYLTNWLVTTNFVSVAVSNLWAGTNFLTVTACEVIGGTNAICSVFANEVTIYRAPAPVVRLTAWLLSGPRPGVWTEERWLASVDRFAWDRSKFYGCKVTSELMP